MLNIPLLKFEKTTNYLNNQLGIQENNKQLLLDIIANIGLILNTSSNNEKDNFESLLESANEFLQTISSNITTIEQLNLEISNITKELTEVLSEQNKTSKTKEFYIASFSNIKHNITTYIEKFQNLEKKLDNDNSNFNEFININNFKYTFESIENEDKESNTNTYEFTGFSVNNQEFSSKNSILENDSISLEEIVPIEDEIEDEKNENLKETNISSNIEFESEISSTKENADDQKIDELTNEFKELLKGLSNGNTEIKNVFEFIKTSLEAEISDIEASDESNLENDVQNIDNNNNDNTDNNEISDELLLSIIEDSDNKEITEIINNSALENSEELSTLENIETSNEEVPIVEIDNSVDMNEIKSVPLPKKNISYSGDSVSDYTKKLYNPNFSIEDCISNEYDLFDIQNSKYKIEPKKEEKLTPILNIQKDAVTTHDADDNIDNEEFENVDNNINDEEFEEENIIDDNIETEELDNNLLSTDDVIMRNDLIDIFDEMDFVDETSIQEQEDEKYKEEDNEKYELEDDEKYDDEYSHNIENDVNDNDKDDDENLSIPEKIEKIKEATYDNETLIISENENKVYLPYKISELLKYVESYPDVYTSLSDVVDQEFILPFDYFTRHPYKARFFETYNLIRNRAGYSVLTALRFSLKLIYKTNLNPVVIAACKTQTELKSLLYHLDNDGLKEFKYFNIIFDVNPL